MRTLSTAGLAALLFLSGPAAADDRPSVRACVGYEIADREYEEAIKAARQTHVQPLRDALARVDDAFEAEERSLKAAYRRARTDASTAGAAAEKAERDRTSAAIGRRIADAQRILEEAVASANARYGAAGEAARASGEADRIRREALQAAALAFRNARDTIAEEEFAERWRVLGQIDETQHAAYAAAARTRDEGLTRARQRHRSERERLSAAFEEVKLDAETAREAAYAAAYGLDTPDASGRSRRVAASLRERHKTLCGQVLSVRHPALARGESEPPLALCTRYAEADEVYDEAEAAADAAFHAAKREIFVSHYPEYASDPDQPRHLIGERVRAFNEEVERVAQAPRVAAKKAARDTQGDAYTAIFAEAGPAFSLIDGFESLLIVRHRGLCRRYQRM